MICEICLSNVENTSRIDIPFKEKESIEVCLGCKTSLGRMAMHMRTCASRAVKSRSLTEAAACKVKIAKKQFLKAKLLNHGD